MEKDHLGLKWGTLKKWHFRGTKKQIAILKEYNSLGVSMGAAQQQDTPRQKELICELIDECNGRIWNDWTGKKMTKKQAKKYVLEY